MEENINTILGIALVITGYGYFSGLLARYNISGPMVFTAVGVLLSPLGFGDKPVQPNSEVVQLVAEIALILVLFSDSSALSIEHIKKHWRWPVRLLFVAMPITIVLTTYTAELFFPAESMVYLFLLALILAPTDAALGKAVVSDTRIPEPVRNTINIESGLNDGIVFPILLTTIAVIGSSGGGESDGWLGYIARQIAAGAVVGAFTGWAGAKISQKVSRDHWIEEQYYNLIPIALAVMAYYAAEEFGGNGFISAFFAGLFLGNTDARLRQHVEEFAESDGELLIMISFLIFGLVFIPTLYQYWDLKTFIFALLSLTVLRMVPVIIGFGMFKIDLPTRLFIGWFGPRGIASILYILVAIHELGGTAGHEKIYAAASLTILLSIVLHGVSAQPLAGIFGRSRKEIGD